MSSFDLFELVAPWVVDSVDLDLFLVGFFILSTKGRRLQSVDILVAPHAFVFFLFLLVKGKVLLFLFVFHRFFPWQIVLAAVQRDNVGNRSFGPNFFILFLLISHWINFSAFAPAAVSTAETARFQRRHRHEFLMLQVPDLCVQLNTVHDIFEEKKEVDANYQAKADGEDIPDLVLLQRV